MGKTYFKVYELQLFKMFLFYVKNKNNGFELAMKTNVVSRTASYFPTFHSALDVCKILSTWGGGGILSTRIMLNMIRNDFLIYIQC